VKNILFALIAMCVCSIDALSQSKQQPTSCLYSIQGLVLYEDTKEPIEGALVFIEELNNYVLTNKNGMFQVDSLCKGKCSLHIDMISCIHKDTLLYLPNTSTITIELIHSFSQEIIIEGRVDSNEPVLSNKEILDKEELARLRGTSLGESLKSVPGVNALQTGPTIFKPVIQGMYGTRVMILNNGIRQEGQQWGNEHAPEVDPFIANKITVIKGPQSIRYGADAIGGVILLDPERLNTFYGTKAQLNLGGFSNNRGGVVSGIVEHGFKKLPGLAVRAQGTLRKGGDSKAPDYWLNNTGYEEANFSLAAAYARNRWGLETFYSQFNTEIGILSWSHIGSVADLIAAIDADKPASTTNFSYTISNPKQIVNHELWKNTIYYTFGRNRIVLEYARQYNMRQEFDSHKAYSSVNVGKPQLELQLTTQIVKGYVEHKSGKYTGVVGATYTGQKNTYEGRYFIPNFQSNAIGIYITESFKANKKTVVEAGLRYDYKHLQSYYYESNVLQTPIRIFQMPTASIGLSHDYSKHVNLLTTLSTGFRPPNVNELYSNGVHHGAAAYEIGDPNLTSELSFNLALTLNYVFKKCYGYIHTYGYYFNDYIYLKPVIPPTLTIRGAFPTYAYTQVDATYAGMDVAFTDSISKKLLFNTRISMVSGYDRTQKDWLIYIPATRWQNGFKYNLKSKGSILKPFVAIDGIIVARKQHVPEDADYKAPPPGYFLLQAEMGAYLKMAKQDVLITITAQNLLNSSYRDYLDRFRYFADAPGRNIILRIQIPLDFTKK
jgi:iron complex outermembrane recepter protein